MKASTELKAVKGDRVQVLNYRRSPEVWEQGEVWSDPETRWHIKDGRPVPWTQYRVRLDRESDASNAIFLYVGASGIRGDR